MSSYHPITPISTSSFPQAVTALSFDPVSDIIWVGSGAGNVTGYYGARGVRGVSFPVSDGTPVEKILSGDTYLRAAARRLGTWTKGGMNKWFTHDSPDIQTFSNTPDSNLVAASTTDMQMLFINSSAGKIIRQTSLPAPVTHLQSSGSLLLSGSSDGYIRSHDPRSGMTSLLTKAHPSGIQGLQTVGNFVLTIGLSERQSRPFPDPLVKVYDLRLLSRPLPPIPFPSGPAFIHAVPTRTSTVVVVSNQGLINVVDILNPTATNEFYQLDLSSYVTSISVSPTASYMAFGDAEGFVHLLTQAEGQTTVPFNGFDGKPINWPDVPAPLPDIDWTDPTPLNSIGLPYYDEPLLSAWSSHLISMSPTYPAPQSIPPQILESTKMKDNVAYAALPTELRGRRNVVSLESQTQARFRSGKSRKIETDPDHRGLDYSNFNVPRLYRRVEIEYSKFGVEDFDFGFYNKTQFSGLETHILNSYTNSVLQVMHSVVPIRQLAKSHITTNCEREHCLLCELGFVVRMLEDARGINCQSSNFCKTVGVLAQASNAIELIDYGRDAAEVDYAHKIQTFHRFLIDHLNSEANTFADDLSLVKDSDRPATSPLFSQLLGIAGTSVMTCQNCQATRDKQNMTYIVDLSYPRKASPSDNIDFGQVLVQSLTRRTSHKATCQSCNKVAVFTSQRLTRLNELPPILAVNACVYNDDTHSLWLDVRGQTFLRPHVNLSLGDSPPDDSSLCYTVRAIVVQVKAGDNRSHLVAIVKVPEAEHREDLSSPWFIFNDFMVENISEKEALSFPDKWKVPAIIYLERVNIDQLLDLSRLSYDIDPAILSIDTSISRNRDAKLVRHELLQPGELPRTAAIDAEFVLMQQEETEYRSDGSNKVIRPARLSLARVSVLRGDGPKQGVPFIDDHIHTSEVIVDYLTEYSGIKFGDLDPNLSRYTLTPLKVVYKKLRLLVDRGCVFIGHGLSKDFRIINIFVPPEQVKDTVDLYFLKARQRRLSLRFLSWYVLHQHIQTDMHDSIEDARSALYLYKAYQTLSEQGIFDTKLEELYKEGRRMNYKPPPAPDLRENDAERDQRSSTPTDEGLAISLPASSLLLLDPGLIVPTPGNIMRRVGTWQE